MSRSRKHVPQPKYIFLTEKEARVKGMFADKFKDEREYKDIPRPYMGGAKSVMGEAFTPATADKRAGKNKNVHILFIFYKNHICYSVLEYIMV